VNFAKAYRVHGKIHLDDLDPDDTHGRTREQAEAVVDKNHERLFKLQSALYAENRRALLIILQGMDTSGKDGVIRHVMRGVNPQGCEVHSFKAPSEEERDHDYLWRIHNAVPARGDIGIFNRSHYEDVLVVRVKDLAPRHVWKKRYDQINDFESLLRHEGVTVVKFFLHISKKEQRERLQKRLADPAKNWKFNPNDLSERKRWDAYMNAYEAALTKTSHKHAPWYVIPANKKWFRDLAVSEILLHTLEKMKPKFPPAAPGLSRLRVI